MKRNAYDARRLARRLRGIGEVRVFSEIGSTNSEAKRILAEETVDERLPLLLVADRQSGGRGRLGRAFYSPEGSGLYCSLLYATEEAMESALRVTSFCAVAVMRAIRRLTGKQTAIKWVNDLYLAGKKVCGILCEGAGRLPDGRHAIVVGIGVNWHPAVFPEELSSIAGSVDEEKIGREELLCAIWQELSALLLGGGGDWLAEYRAHSLVLGQRIRWREGELWQEGVALSIGEDGALHVRRTDGRELDLRTGEITLRVAE